MAVNGVFDMGFKVIGERCPHVHNADRRMIQKGGQFICLDQSGVVHVLKKDWFGRGGVGNKKEQK
jgi:hypothetical protein